MASNGVTDWLDARVCVHALRLVICSFATAAICCLILSSSAHAQFVCDGPDGTSSDLNCTITGAVAGPFDRTTTASGNVTITNTTTGTVSDHIEAAADGGNARINNAGSVESYISAWSVSGNATIDNSGAVDAISSVAFGSGTALTINSATGVVRNLTSAGASPIPSLAGILTGSFSGDATTINFGSVSGGPGGTAILTASGLGGGDGNATTKNYGRTDGIIVTASGVSGGNGNATTYNYGSAGGTQTLVSEGGNATVVNFGSFTAPAQALVNNAGNASVVNYGTIDTHDLAPVFAETGFGTASVANSGTILGSVGAFVDFGGLAIVTNSGLIDASKTFDGVAIDLRQFDTATPTALNLLTGSRVIGTILLNGDVTDPLAVGTRVNIQSGPGLSSVLTFGGAPSCGCSGGPGGLTDTGAVVNVTGGRPYVISGNSVAVLDPTSFGAQDRNVLDFTRTVLSTASSRLTSPAPIGGDGSAALGFAPSGNVARDMAADAFANIPALAYADQNRVLRSNPNFTAADGTSIWAQGFGGVRVQNADGPNLRSVNQFYGGLIGTDKVVQPGLRLGAFAGGGSISSQIDMNSGRTTSDTGFAGVYARYAINKAFLDFALVAGGSSNNVKRTMTNNLVVGGYDYASGNYGGWFVSPELAYGVKQDLTREWAVTPTARVRYLAANFGGYQESGSANGISVAGRTSHNFEERGELVFSRTTQEREGSLLQINATVGALAWQRAGDGGINTVLLGQALAFATPGKANVYGGYAGGGFNWRQSSGVSIFGAAEVTAMSDSSHTITGHGGVKLAF